MKYSEPCLSVIPVMSIKPKDFQWQKWLTIDTISTFCPNFSVKRNNTGNVRIHVTLRRVRATFFSYVKAISIKYGDISTNEDN